MGNSNSDEARGSWTRWRTDAVRALVGGVVTLVIGAGCATMLGTASAFEIRQLTEALVRTLPYLGSAGMASSSTILALMLTLLGLTRQSDAKLSNTFFQRLVWTARQAGALFCCSLLLLLVLSAPLAEADVVDYASTLIHVQFYATAGLTALLAGLAVSLILTLQSTLIDLVALLGIGVDEHYLLAGKPSGEHEATDA